MNKNKFDCIVIGGGQSGLALGYYLRRTDLDYVILDKNDKPGGSWQFTWESLTLFSPAQFSSLPGWQMPETRNLYPEKDEVIDYLAKYEEKYKLNVERSVLVKGVKKTDKGFVITTNKGEYYSKYLIASAGTYEKPFIPNIDGLDSFLGEQIHSADYKVPEDFIGKHTLVVGEGNSGAQIIAELSKVTLTYWAVKKDPEFLPADVDGRVLFDSASAIYYAKQKGEKVDKSTLNLGNIVQVPPVKEALERGVLNEFGKIKIIKSNSVVWENGEETLIDAIIWCTGFNYNTEFLNELTEVRSDGKIELENNRAKDCEGLYLVGYGGWTGFASATLIGVGRTAREVVKQIGRE